MVCVGVGGTCVWVAVGPVGVVGVGVVVAVAAGHGVPETNRLTTRGSATLTAGCGPGVLVGLLVRVDVGVLGGAPVCVGVGVCAGVVGVGVEVAV